MNVGTPEWDPTNVQADAQSPHRGARGPFGSEMVNGGSPQCRWGTPPRAMWSGSRRPLTRSGIFGRGPRGHPAGTGAFPLGWRPPAQFSKRITLHHRFPLPRKSRSAPASPKRAVKKKARPKVERPREPVVQDRPTDKETAKQPRAKRTPEQSQEYERARNQMPERREYNRRYAQEQRQKAKGLGKCRDCSSSAILGQTRCESCAENHRQSRRRNDARRRAAAKGELAKAPVGSTDRASQPGGNGV